MITPAEQCRKPAVLPWEQSRRLVLSFSSCVTENKEKTGLTIGQSCFFILAEWENVAYEDTNVASQAHVKRKNIC